MYRECACLDEVIDEHAGLDSLDGLNRYLSRRKRSPSEVKMEPRNSMQSETDCLRLRRDMINEKLRIRNQN